MPPVQRNDRILLCIGAPCQTDPSGCGFLILISCLYEIRRRTTAFFQIDIQIIGLTDCQIQIGQFFFVFIQYLNPFKIPVHVDHFDLYREGTMRFQGVPVDGSTKMPDAHMDAIEPFDYSEMVPFSVAYLPGYITDRYDLDVRECNDRATRRGSNTALEEMEGTAGGYREIHTASHSENVTWTHIAYALLPVWMLHTRWNGTDYLFAMNGQTGKLIGDLPIDKGKKTKRFLMLFLPIMIVLAFAIFSIFGIL